MAINTNFERKKIVAGGIRSDAPISTDDGDSVALRIDNKGGLLINTIDPSPTYIVDSSGTELDIDYGIPTIELEHYYIHEQAHFFGSDYDVDTDTNATKYWQIVAPDTATRCHATWIFQSSLNGIFYVYENPSLSSQGTPITCYNNDRNSDATPEMTFLRDPGVSSPGTLITSEYVGSAGANPSGAGAVGAGTQRKREIILKQNYHYLFAFTAKSDNEQTTLTLSWYEL